MRHALTPAWLLALALALAACGGGSKGNATSEKDGGSDGTLNDGGNMPADAGVDAAVPQTGTAIVQGQVSLTDGKAVGGIEVRVGNQKAKTDNRGFFRVKNVPNGKHQVVVEDKAHSGAQLPVEVKDGDTAQVSLSVLPLKTMILEDAAKGGQISQDGVTVKLPAKSLKKRDGKSVTGPVEARYAVIDKPVDVAAAPGGMKAEMNDDVVELESFGMVDMRFYQDDEMLELAESAEADLSFPMGPNAFNDGDEVPIWSFDDISGVWKQEGAGIVDKSGGGNGVAKAKAKHFSWWNADKPLEDKSCLTGKLLTADGDPIPNMALQVTGIDYLTNLSTVTAADGSFCVTVKRGSQNQLSAFGGNDAAFFSWSATASAGAEATSCELGGCVDVGTLMGESLFAECTGNVTDDENHVLLLSSGDGTLDTNVQTVLEGYGNQVTIGPQYTAFDGMTDLAAYDVVYLQANSNWSGGDMPVEGQRQLINWVNCGGGLVTVEWTVWKIGTGQFQLIDAVYPAVPTTAFMSQATATYVKVGDDATMHNGLPDTFTFTADNFAGTEIDLVARPGATTFFDSQTLGDGVIGWDYNLGRVVSISTCAGSSSLADANYSRMIGNTVDWLQRDPAQEPMGK